LSLAHYTLLAVGRSDDEADALIDAMRGRATMPTETFAAMRTREFRTAMGMTPGQKAANGTGEG
jgi:hypothetical protein